MSNQIKVVKNAEVKVFDNQQQAADFLGVTKQAVSKAMRKGHECQGARLSVLYYKCAYTDKSKCLIIDGKLIGSYDKIQRKNGNVFLTGFVAND
ncbi:hypothetical protein [Enterococcus caccae]|uniref:Uncharacterized protein n=1 Tax=Enterococcus caccae ATCC BAA-1240 TaxID=1158612 RepID=R3WD24_9ENTE|nr:hypothetical protein [Enterococcus caccae]EOL45801.1 hypothetical protein UC7_01598 [Enterococcus caccae ATCC BAA-1240]EOT60997.1 hypothetical protein I580_01899 [Enterococcus caccae ATCC BAA-1240]